MKIWGALDHICKSPSFFLQITFTGDKRDPVDEVFLTRLEMEVAELSHIAASVKGDLLVNR